MDERSQVERTKTADWGKEGRGGLRGVQVNKTGKVRGGGIAVEKCYVIIYYYYVVFVI